MSDNKQLPEELRAWEAAGEYLTIGPRGHRIFARSVGRRDASPDSTLLLLHGYPESSHLFHANLDALARRFEHVVLFDFLGFGLSDKPSDASYSLFEQADLALEVWRQLGVRGGHIVGHDMGDSVATELLARRSSGLLPAYLEGGFPSITFTNGNMVMRLAKLRIGQRLLRVPRLGALLGRVSRYPVFANQVRSAAGSGRLPEREIELMWAAQRYKDGHLVQHRIIGYLDERDKFEASRWLPAVTAAGVDKVPVHICWGALDSVAPTAVVEYLKSEICPSARLTLLPGVGHFCQLEDPAAWSDGVLRFWDSLSEGRGAK